MLLLQPPPPETQFEWSHAGRELLAFLGWFALYGAAAFGAIVLRAGGSISPVTRRRAAGIGLLGVLLAVGAIALGLRATAAEKGIALGAAAQAGGGALAWRLGAVAVAAVGFLVALAGRRAGFALALLAALGIALRNVVTGDWTRLINPVHVLAGGLWIGTLFVLVVAGLPLAARRTWPQGRHAAAAAAMVRRFSALALASSALLAVTGGITAWRHLAYVAALWTTPYGWALCAKLAVVLVVLSLGAYNWRAVSARLGTDAGTATLARSARRELALALVVLLITAVLVSLPTPKAPGP